MFRHLFFASLSLFLLGACNASTDASEPRPYQVEVLTDGLSHPWSMAFLPGGEVLITEKAGRLRIWRDGKLLENTVSGLPDIHPTGQGGLLDLALHPDFADNRWLYFSYVANHEGDATTHVARGRYRDARLSDVEVLFIAEPAGDTGRHFGSRLVFDQDGYLYLTVGDRGEQPRAQDLSDHAGGTHRLHADGRIPDDNPFVDRDDVKPSFYTYGNRNAQGMTVHPDTGVIWQVEHGPRGGDELNIIEAGNNYGWPVITYGINYSGSQIGEGITHKEGMEQPVHYWDPSIAPSGLAVYTGDAFPDWQGNFFVGALAHEHLARLVLEDNKVVKEEKLLEERGERIRDVRQGPDGLLWILTDESNGSLLRLKPATDSRP
ncbi:PQQ-dependent sugar dehydrogenase [Thiohalophilus thiocyanatoxydans]|uniref:Glucose/arabinose dehydrogenase n=1 Tax=Thiohalophilus thiocyanatoxydans TaxID=381308 RepID=A0A4V3H4Q2_9GAMM|nr:PQQ-dependent sugar dehydrogenase [Thiohalophilus thiocyanatoxydans]TDY04005.1 glucose/arabinose dehydrogenase [Thiohalophilus thiocyanatoxydans]